MNRKLRLVPLIVLLLGGLACSSVSALRPATPAPAAQLAAQPAVTKPEPASNASQAGGSAADQAIPDTSAQIQDCMVIRTAQLTVEVQSIESALAQARSIASKGGGFVSASNTHVEQDHMVADLTLDVRSDSADSVISDLRAL